MDRSPLLVQLGDFVINVSRITCIEVKGTDEAGREALICHFGQNDRFSLYGEDAKRLRDYVTHLAVTLPLTPLPP